MKQVGNHEFTKEDGVWTCEHCRMEVAPTYFDGVANQPCIYGREQDSDEDEE